MYILLSALFLILMVLLIRKRPWLGLSVLLLCLALGGLLVYLIYNGSRSDPMENADYIVVAGCQVQGTEPSPQLRERLEKALEAASLHPEATLIVCGGKGSGEDISEAQAMATYLMAHGIPPERILLDATSTTTRENLTEAFKLIEEQGTENPRILVVSSEYHLFRIRLIAKDLGYTVQAAGSETHPFHTKLNCYIREAGALVKAIWENIFH